MSNKLKQTNAISKILGGVKTYFKKGMEEKKQSRTEQFKKEYDAWDKKKDAQEMARSAKKEYRKVKRSGSL